MSNKPSTSKRVIKLTSQHGKYFNSKRKAEHKSELIDLYPNVKKQKPQPKSTYEVLLDDSEDEQPSEPSNEIRHIYNEYGSMESPTPIMKLGPRFRLQEPVKHVLNVFRSAVERRDWNAARETSRFGAFGLLRTGKLDHADGFNMERNAALNQAEHYSRDTLDKPNTIIATALEYSLRRLGEAMSLVKKFDHTPNLDADAHLSHLRLSTPEHESRLMVQAGERPSPADPSLIIDSPPCINEKDCICLHWDFGPGTSEDTRFVMMSYLTPSEYESHIKRAEQPALRRPCILCMRYIVAECYFNTRCDNITFTHPRDAIVQMTYCRVDEIGGYKKECCLHPESKPYNGLIAPTPGFYANLLLTKKDRHGRFYVDQSRMVVSGNDQRSVQRK